MEHQNANNNDADFDAIMDCEIHTANELLYGELLPIFEEVDERHGGGDLAYSLWVALTRWLAATGWKPDDLARDTGWHAADETSDGHA